MTPKHLLDAESAALLILGTTIAIACVADKWDEKEPDKGHKLVDAAMRCVLIPTDHAADKAPRTALETTNTCQMGAGRAAEPAPTLIRTTTSCTSPGRVRTSKWHRQISGRQPRWHLLLREPDGHFLRRHLQWHGAIALSWLPPATAKSYLNRG
jgi:hypothetical protein